MIPYEEARRLVLEQARTCPPERVPTSRAGGRILAEDVRALIASPPFDKAAMDGYAVRRQDLNALPVELEVVGEVFAGGSPGLAIGPGQAAVIATGAPVPDGADAVVMVEHTDRPAPGRVRVLRAPSDNVCRAGEDVQAGQAVLRAGQVLTPLRIGVAAAAGHAELAVYGRPAAALLCTGNEVVEPGQHVPPGSIYNANGPMLSALIAPLCRSFIYLGNVGDAEPELRARVRRGLECDVLLISGGVSMGRYDLVPAALEQAGVEEIFHTVAIKPGKPTWFGRAHETLVFGVPGNPQSCFVVFRMLVASALAAMGGVRDLPPRFKTGVMAEGFRNDAERMNVMPCVLEQAAGVLHVRRAPYHGSADIVGPSAADGYFVVPRGVERVAEGDEVQLFRS